MPNLVPSPDAPGSVDRAELRRLLVDAELRLPLRDNLKGEIVDAGLHYIGDIEWLNERTAVIAAVNALPDLLDALDTAARLEAELADAKRVIQSLMPGDSGHIPHTPKATERRPEFIAEGRCRRCDALQAVFAAETRIEAHRRAGEFSGEGLWGTVRPLKDGETVPLCGPCDCTKGATPDAG